MVPGNIAGMDGFANDAESAELTNEECAAFAHLVRYACHPDGQNHLSAWLARIQCPQPGPVCDFAQRQARRMWRTELRV